VTTERGESCPPPPRPPTLPARARAFPFVYVAWQDFGFQRDDPVSDLRACGRLALQQLVYLLENYPTTVRETTKQHSRSRNALH
jgi:hypothetical protein